jgi:hypothetical protein
MEEGAHLVVAGKKRERKKARSLYALQEHAPNDLTSS